MISKFQRQVIGVISSAFKSNFFSVVDPRNTLCHQQWSHGFELALTHSIKFFQVPATRISIGCTCVLYTISIWLLCIGPITVAEGSIKAMIFYLTETGLYTCADCSGSVNSHLAAWTGWKTTGLLSEPQRYHWLMMRQPSLNSPVIE